MSTISDDEFVHYFQGLFDRDVEGKDRPAAERLKTDGIAGAATLERARAAARAWQEAQGLGSKSLPVINITAGYQSLEEAIRMLEALRDSGVWKGETA